MATSEVENLLEDIDRDLGDCNKAPDCSYFHNRMVALIAAAKEEGVVEYKAQLEAELQRPDMGRVYYPEDSATNS